MGSLQRRTGGGKLNAQPLGAQSLDEILADPVVLKPKRDKPVRQGHPWVFSGAVQRLPADRPDGSIVAVVDAKLRWLAWGYLNRSSQICVRLLSWDQTEAIDDRFWQRRLSAAVERRASLAADPETNAYRLVNAESDFLPGLTVDRYADYLVLQAGTLAVDQRKHQLAEALMAITGCHGVFERSEADARRREGLGAASGLLAGEMPTSTVIVLENGLRFHVDLVAGQKTGFYTDQRDNRQRVATYCAGKRVLNGFSYSGGFGIYALAAGADHVANIDSSADVLALAEQNRRLNGLDPASSMENISADLFQYLREQRSHGGEGPRWDVIVLDPPKFAQSKRNVDRALRGYKDINLLAMQLLAPGGILATFSCSGLVSADLFQKVVFGAAVDAGRDVQIVEWLRQGPDHPVAITFPEGEYLKGLVCRVL